MADDKDSHKIRLSKYALSVRDEICSFKIMHYLHNSVEAVLL